MLWNDFINDNNCTIFVYDSSPVSLETGFFQVLNLAMLSATRTLIQPFFPFLRLLLKAMQKLPRFSGHRLYRPACFDFTSVYVKNCDVIEWTFTSCSTEKIIDPFVFCFVSGELAGVDISMFSRCGKKNRPEVLMFPGLTYNVADIELKSAQNKEITLRLLPFHPKIERLHVFSIENGICSRCDFNAAFICKFCNTLFCEDCDRKEHSSISTSVHPRIKYVFHAALTDAQLLGLHFFLAILTALLNFLHRNYLLIKSCKWFQNKNVCILSLFCFCLLFILVIFTQTLAASRVS